MTSVITGSMFARLTGVSRQRISDLALDGKLERTHRGRFDLDAPLNAAFLGAHRAEAAASTTASNDEQGEGTAYSESYVTRLLRGAFAEGEGSIFAFTKHGDGPDLFKRIAGAARKAKDLKQAEAAVERILDKKVTEVAGELKATEELYLTFGRTDNGRLDRELCAILWEDEDGRSLDEVDDPSEESADSEAETPKSGQAVGATAISRRKKPAKARGVGQASRKAGAGKKEVR